MTHCKKKDCVHYAVCAYKACKFVCPYYKCNTSAVEFDKMFIVNKSQDRIHWTDKLFITHSGDIIDFEGRVLGHINLEDIGVGAE